MSINFEHDDKSSKVDKKAHFQWITRQWDLEDDDIVQKIC